MLRLLIFCCLFLVLFVCCRSSGTDHDFYSILGVNKKSTPKEIKEAYREQIKKWHPEVNPSEEAGHRFHLITEAYKTLSDPQKKSLYEVFGKGSVDIDIFLADDDLAGDGFHLVTSQFMQTNSNDLWTITSKYFDKIVKPESFKHPFVIFVKSRKCEDCQERTTTWIDWCHQLALEGVKCGQIIVEDERWLLRRLGAATITTCGVVGILEGKASWSSTVPSSLQELTLFTISFFNKDFIQELTSEDYLEFLRTCSQERNHVSMLLCTNSFVPPLSFYTSLFHTRSHISGGFVHTKNPTSRLLMDTFNISIEKMTVLVFKEDRHDPVFKLSLKSFKRKHFDQIILKHPLLKTPRISCPAIFDLVCPLDMPKNMKKLCVILLVSSDSIFESHLSSFQRFSEDYTYGDRVKFGFLYVEKQKSFVQLVTWGKGIYNSTTNALKVMILWRKDQKNFNYDFLEGGWHSSGNDLQRSRRKLVQLLDWLLKSSTTLPNVVEIKKEIVNEHLKSLWRRILTRLKDWKDGCLDFLLGVDNATYLIVLKTLAFVIVLGFSFRYLALREVQMIQGSKNICNHSSAPLHPKNNQSEKPVIYIHMLCPENYKTLLTESPATVRLILLLVDSASKERLIKYFGSFLQPYARSTAFKFAFVDLDQHFHWYVQLLDTTMRQSEHYQVLKKCFSNINIKNCLGTVLAVNGVKKYFFMYHISSFKSFPLFQQKGRNSDVESDDDDCSKDTAVEEYKIGVSHSTGLLKRRNNAHKKIFDSTQEHPNKKLVDADKLFEFDLLRGLGSWLEKLCQGRLKKFRVSQWPKEVVRHS